MARQLVEFKQADTWEPKKKGDSVEGHYVEKRVIQSKGKEYIKYVIEQESGEDIEVWSTFILDNFFSHMPFKTWVKITSMGKEPSKSDPDKEYWTYKLEHEPVEKLRPVNEAKPVQEKKNKTEGEDDLPF